MEEIISNVSSFINFKHLALGEIKKIFSDDNVITKPPNYFKLGTLQEIDESSKTMRVMVDTKVPFGNCGDGASVNKKAARVLRDLYGFSSPGMIIRL